MQPTQRTSPLPDKPAIADPALSNAGHDARRLAAAARLGRRGWPASSPNPAVGAILVANGRVVATGTTQPGGRPHAEAQALQQAGKAARAATLYVSLEPCAHRSDRGPSCADLIVEARPARVVIGQADPDPRTAGRGASRLRDAGIEVAVLDDDACEAALAPYLLRRRMGRPFVTLKLAMSIDGRIALASGESRWITGKAARAHVHSRRAQADAILVGGGTWRADRPRLDVRLPGLASRSPRRILLSRGVAPDGTTVINAPQAIATLDDVQHVYVEGGGQAAASFLAADLVDALHIYRAPILIGEGRPAIGDLGIEALDEARGRWRQVERRQLGMDSFTAYRRTRQDRQQEADPDACSPG